LDKQPHFPNWVEGVDNTKPGIINGKLYGRGGADDGYALPSAALLIKILQDFGLPHGRIILIGENEEESGSPNLEYLLRKLQSRIGNPEIVICLDSGVLDYSHFLMAVGLKGLINFNLTVKVLENGMHSGDASGIVPSSFRIIRSLLDRLENSKTGDLLVPELYQKVDPNDYLQLNDYAKELTQSYFNKYYEIPGIQLTTNDIYQIILIKTILPTLSITGADGIPHISVAGNVLRPSTSLKLSIRVPPSVDVFEAFEAVKKILIRDPPYSASIEISDVELSSGFSPPYMALWLKKAIDDACQKVFNYKSIALRGGGSIPVMSMLTKIFPDSQCVVTGVLGPGSNSHAANECLNIDYLKKIMLVLSQVIVAHATKG
jgi:acetylornithine deacetylase/succinyl-diaminopimelate desuccinylase-like protein